MSSSSDVLNLTEDNFETEVLKSSDPVLIDFWAAWCGPCQMVAPLMDEVASEYSGRLKVGKVNVDEQQGLAARYHVQSIPTLLFLKDGEVVDTLMGAPPRDVLVDRIEKMVGDGA